jgi:hypothetical protein
VGDAAGQLELVPEAFDHLLVEADVRAEDLQGDGLADLLVDNFVDAAHAAAAEFIGYAVAPGEHGPGDDLAAGDAGGQRRGWRGSGECGGCGWRGDRAGAEERGAVAAVPGIRDVLELAMRAFHGENPLLIGETSPDSELMTAR